MKKPWWQHEAAIAWALILFFPLGIFTMWRYAPWRNRFKWLWTVITPIVALFVVAAAVGGASEETDDSSATAGVSPPAASPTRPAPGLTAVTSEVLVPEPTATPKATATPEPPKATEESGPAEVSAVECEYLKVAIMDRAVLVLGAMITLGDLAENPRFFSAEWRASMAAQLATLQEAHDEVVALQPPESLRPLHAQYVKALSSLDSAADLTARGIDDLDAYLVQEGGRQMMMAGEQFSVASKMSRDFWASRSGSCDF